MYKNYQVAVVMPIHNEANHIEQAIGRVPDYVDLIIAVDDGSTDFTWQKLSLICDERLILLRHPKNLGVGAATKTGYRYAQKTAADFVAVMDGDGQMDGRDLYRLLDEATRGVDFIKGNRFLSQTVSCMPLGRYLGNRLFSFLTRRAVAFAEKLDAQCGYTVIRREALKHLELESLYNRYGFPNEMFFEAYRAGLKIQSVPVRAVYGDEVSGINPFTAVPTICYLIARSFYRHRKTALRLSKISRRKLATEEQY
jgi:glycosyltransferase involved in cell wall biosynthesis